jgi:glutamate transport system substrate-binding protein
MRRRPVHRPARRSVLAVLAFATAICLGACTNSSQPGATLAQAPATVPTVPDGSVLSTIRQRGTIRIGVKFDVPLFGYKSESGELEGFDIEIAKLIERAIFNNADGSGTGSKIEFVEALSKDRETFLQNGTVDLVVSTYTITESRKQFVDFAGPYYIAGQDILARKDDIASGRINGIGSLNGKKVCAVTGSTSLQNLLAGAPKADVSVTAERYPECFEALKAGRVDAMTTDDVILLGLIRSSRDQFALTGNPFRTEPYGVGVPKGEYQLRDLVNTALRAAFADGRWADAFRATVGAVGASVPAPPTIDGD